MWLKCKPSGTSSSRPFWCPFKWKWPKKGYTDRKDKKYEVKLKPKKYPDYAEVELYNIVSVFYLFINKGFKKKVNI